SIVEVLSGLAPDYTTFLVLRALFGIGMGGEWGVGASLAMEKVPPRLRGVLLFFSFSGLGLAADVLYRGTSCAAGVVREIQSQRVGGVAKKPSRELERSGTCYCFPLETLSLPDAPHDDDEFHLARHPGHVPDLSKSTERVHAARGGCDSD